MPRHDFNSVLDFLIEKEDDPKFCAAVLAGLSKEIMQKYFEERRASNYEPPEFMPDQGTLTNITALKNSQCGADAVNPLADNFAEEESKEVVVEKTTDVFGKSI